jgi:protein-disulfide isomerase
MQDGLVKKIISGFTVFAVVMAALWFAWNLTTKPAEQAQDANKPVSIEVTDADHKLGAKNGKVTLVEFSDFQCPACKAFAPLVKKLMEDYGTDVTLVYKYFPLPQHDHAEAAAYAAEAAGKQGKFFEMHDILFEKQDEWSTQSDPNKFFEKYAASLKLNMAQYKKDLASDEAKSIIEKDVLAGTQAGVNSTPSFYLDGVKVNNPGSYEEFAGLVTAAIAKNQKLLKKVLIQHKQQLY